MALFEFDLYPVEKIAPWGLPDQPSLSWFALSLGRFRMPVGDQTLFRYTEEIASHFGDDLRDADYQIASLAQDILGSFPAGVASLPPIFEYLALNRELLDQLIATSAEDDDEEDELHYTASRWLGERSPWASYFVKCPEFYFVRIQDRLHIRWDNRKKLIEGLKVWEATYGSWDMSVSEFELECRNFSQRLLAEMEGRISRIQSGAVIPQAAVSIESLRQQHTTWCDEFDSYFHPEPPDIPWDEAENAVRELAARRGIVLPKNAL